MNAKCLKQRYYSVSIFFVDDKINGIAGFACVIYFSFYFVRFHTDNFFLIAERSTQCGCQSVLFYHLCIFIVNHASVSNVSMFRMVESLTEILKILLVTQFFIFGSSSVFFFWFFSDFYLSFFIFHSFCGHSQGEILNLNVWNLKISCVPEHEFTHNVMYNGIARNSKHNCSSSTAGKWNDLFFGTFYFIFHCFLWFIRFDCSLVHIKHIESNL